MEKTIILEISGMSCTSCANTIEKALIKSNYVEIANVNFTNKKAYVTLIKEVDPEHLIKIVKDAGYKAKLPGKKIRKEYVVNGMSCTSCALNIEKNVKKIPGIIHSNVSFTDKKLIIETADDSISFDKLQNVVQKIGYNLVNVTSDSGEEEDSLKKEKRRLILAWMITIPLTIKMLFEMIGGLFFINEQIAFVIDFILSFVVIFIIGFPVIRSTWFSIKKLSFNMDSLIGIGTLAAYSTGILKLTGLEIENFMVVGAMIMSINFIGNYLKTMATGRASQAIKQLMELGAKSTHLISSDGQISNVPIESLNVDDVVLVKPGEKIPVDGVIIEGRTTIDESIATGESIPVDKDKNDQVIGATVNKQGSIKVRIQKIGKETFLSQIIKMVEEAQGSKIPIQAFADKVTQVFVPIILLLSLATFVFWFFFPESGKSILVIFDAYLPWISLDRSVLSMALFSSIAALVIACPCALGLATPTALMVGMGKGAVNGILIKNGEAIQTAQQIDTVVFDKTGTVTKGKPVLMDFVSSIEENDFLKLVGSVEQFSEHPLASAIVDSVIARNIELRNIEHVNAVSGKGIEADYFGSKVKIGSKRFFDDLSISDSKFDSFVEKSQSKGYTLVFVAKDNDLIGILCISDEIKSDSKKAVKKLHSLDIKTVMLTGDNKRTAISIAKSVEIDQVFAELLPQDKISIIKSLQKEGRIVAMVGDGINDAPALKQANIGIAIGTGTDIAIESSDITLVSGSLTGVYRAIELSKATFKKIMQNLFWAFFYNVIAIPVALMGLLHPAVAEVAMAFSSINVVANSLRLKKVKLDDK